MSTTIVKPNEYCIVNAQVPSEHKEVDAKITNDSIIRIFMLSKPHNLHPSQHLILLTASKIYLHEKSSVLYFKLLEHKLTFSNLPLQFHLISHTL